MPTALAFNETAIGAVRDREFGALFVRNFSSMVTVPVSVDADPCPTVQWYFNGTLIAANDPDYTISNPCTNTSALSPFVFTLTVTNLTEERSGSYSATFENTGGNGTSPPLYITLPGMNAFSSYLAS